jgi:hypothetical protein
MTQEQQQEIRVAASLIIQRCMGLLGYPTTHNQVDVDLLQVDLDRMKAVMYEIDARNSHDDSTAIPERKAA